MKGFRTPPRITLPPQLELYSSHKKAVDPRLGEILSAIADFAHLANLYRSVSAHYVAKANPKTCRHLNKRSFTFSTGEMISLCPDCDKTTGTEVLHVPNILKPSEACALFYEGLLSKQGLSMYAGLSPMLSYRTPGKLSAIEHAKAFRDRWGGVRVKLNSWTREHDGEDEESVSNTRSDRSSRDYRAREALRSKGDYIPVTAESALCKRCALRFTSSRKGTKYCSDNCRKRHYEEKERT